MRSIGQLRPSGAANARAIARIRGVAEGPCVTNAAGIATAGGLANGLGVARAVVAAIALGVIACGSGDPGSNAAADDRTVALVGGRRIGEAELDRPLQIALHDLARDRYEMRLARLRWLIEGGPGEQADEARRDGGKPRASAAPDAVIRLEPPQPPRLDLELPGRPLYGSAGAPIAVTVFCDFDAPDCARLQPSLRTLVAEFPGRVRVAHRDLLLAPAPDPVSVAAAVGCADEQGEIQRFVRAVITPPVRRGRAGLLRIARELHLDDDVFAECLASGRQAAWVDESDTLARHLGIRVAPTSFVNGLYVRGVDLGEVRRLVGQELTRLGEQASPEILIAQRAGLSLVGMVRNARPARSLATIRIAREGRTRSFRPGESIVDGIVLEHVRDDGVFLRDGARVEFLPVLQSPPPHSLARRPGPPGPEVRIEVGGPPIDDFRVVGRGEVEQALDRRLDLESMLGVDESDAAGRGLLHLAEVEPGSLYDQLGLEPGDVLVEVDDAPIYEEDNPLWDALATQSRVRLVVRRDGATWESEIEIE